MKKTLQILSLIAGATLALPVLAQSAPQTVGVVAAGGGQFTAAEKTQVQGVITGLDKANRNVTIKGSTGNELFLVIGEEAKNFDQIVVGDMVTLTYAHALALELRKSDKKVLRQRQESSDAARSAPGEKPAGVVVKTVNFIADVTKVDTKAKTITLRGVQRTLELKVDDPAKLKNIKVGDQVEGVYKEAVAIEVTPQAKK
jgi:Cu/Ag efflux protein CusF